MIPVEGHTCSEREAETDQVLILRRLVKRLRQAPGRGWVPLTLGASPTPAVTQGRQPDPLARDCQGKEIARRADEAPSLPCCICPYGGLLLLEAQRARRSWFHAFLYYSAPILRRSGRGLNRDPSVPC